MLIYKRICVLGCVSRSGSRSRVSDDRMVLLESFQNESLLLQDKGSARRGLHRLEQAKTSPRKSSQSFNPLWEEQYLCTASSNDNTVLCLVCGQVFGTPKQFNLSRHYKNKHMRDFENLNGIQRALTIVRLKEGLHSKINMF